MKLSAPIHILKNRAKTLKLENSITMVKALDQIAYGEGYPSWSLLQAKVGDHLPTSDEEILGYLKPGDLMLLGARPGLGKTRFAMEMLVQALKEKRRVYFFSLEFTETDLASRIEQLAPASAFDSNLLLLDVSDEISSGYIIEKLKARVAKNALIVIDYLQLLDQKRSQPSLETQIEALKHYAKENGCVMIFISQIDRHLESKGRTLPTISDIRMPNPFDVKLFNKVMLMNEKEKIFLRPKSFVVSL